MAVATVTVTTQGFPVDVDNTMRREVVYGIATFVGASPSYVLGGIRVNFNLEKLKCQTMIPAWTDLGSVSGSGYQYIINSVGALITNIALTTNVVTITANNNLAVGDKVLISGVTTATFLNGVTLTVAAGVSATSFTAPFTHANYGTAGDTGFALPTTYVSGLPFQGNLQIFTGAAAQSPLAELSTGALPAGIVGSATVNADQIAIKAEFIRAL
jgi:hypothetical protein